jgi:hypothetical protein
MVSTMKNFYSIIVFILVGFIMGCGTPNDPDSIIGGDGGYKIVSKIITSGFAQDVIVKDSLAYLAQGEGGLTIINVSNHSDPKILSTLTKDCRGYSGKIALSDSIVYLAAGTFGITSIDIADPANPLFKDNNRNPRPAKDFCIFGKWMFIAISEEGVKIAELSYPAQPDLRGGMITPGYAQGVAVSSDSNYALVTIGEMGLAFYDISQLQNGFGDYPVVHLVDLPGYAENVIISPDYDYAFVACGTGGLSIVDYSDSANVRAVGHFDTGGYAKEVYYQNNKIYISTELRGLQIIDVSNPADPVRIGTVQTQYAKGVTADDKYIYVADEDEGLVIISIPD